MHVLNNNGSLIFTDTSTPFNTPITRLRTFDLNNDGKKDFVSHPARNLPIYIAVNNGNNTLTGSTINPPAGISVITYYYSKNFSVADFDNDGYFDRSFWNSTTGLWRYYPESVTNSPQSTFLWGSPNDVPVPNDYDGDGQTDHAIYRKSDGTWWIFKSSIGQSYAQAFGLPEDKPVPADYDGDGKAGIAVFRDGVWYVLRPDGSSAVMFWGTTNDFPFFNDSPVAPSVSVFRKTNSTIYTTSPPVGLFGTTLPSGPTTNEIFTSSILPPD